MTPRPRSISRRDPDEDIHEELQYDFDRRVDDLVRTGIPVDEARRHVRHAFGDLNVLKEECRDVRPLAWLSDLLRDVRIGARSLRRDRLVALSVILILAVGIGATVTMSSILHTVVLRPLPYGDAARLVTLSTHDLARNQWDGTSFPNFVDWRAQSTSLAALTCYRRTHVSQVTFGADAPRRAQEGLVCPGFFEVIGAPPLLGRTFTEDEFNRGRVVVLSEGLWREHFGGSATALGQTLDIDGRDHLVIGVMPRAFQLPTPDTRFWRPITVQAAWPDLLGTSRDGDGIEVLGRLASGISLEDARRELAVVAARLREQHAVNRNRDIRVAPLFDHVVGPRTRRSVWLGFAAVLSLLAVACANVGGLLTARAARRGHEFAVRAALGAGKARLVRQLLAEAVGLWFIAGAAGVVIAYGAMEVVRSYGLPRTDQLAIDVPSVTLALVAGLIVIVLAGTLPGAVAGEVGARTALRSRGESSLPGGGWHDVLVVVQMGGALVLVVAAVLFAQSFLRATDEDPGYPADSILVVHVADRSRVPGFFYEMQTRFSRLPGVVAVGGVKQFFLRRNADQQVVGEGKDSGVHDRLAVDAVTPGYFRSMDIPLLQGRDFDQRDVGGTQRVSIVNETMARRLWPGEDPIGKRWASGSVAPQDRRWTTVVGVVRDMRREGLDRAPIASAFVPDVFSGNFDVTVRTSGRAVDLIPAIRQELRSIDATLAVPDVAAASDHLSKQLGGRRLEAHLLSMFAAVALVLSAAGLYASFAYRVASRTREIGIRAALGAPRGQIGRMVVTKAMSLATIGCLIGLVGAAIVSRSIQSLLYGTPALSASSYAVASFMLLVVALGAASIPAYRAAAVDPLIAIRDE
jgi:predicted permease